MTYPLLPVRDLRRGDYLPRTKATVTGVGHITWDGEIPVIVQKLSGTKVYYWKPTTKIEVLR